MGTAIEHLINMLRSVESDEETSIWEVYHNSANKTNNSKHGNNSDEEDTILRYR